jgi:AmmeMemoRadiSam system protein B/AmmeMemoRadiSam system protein A
MTIKNPAVAGQFYPSDAAELQKMISSMLAVARKPTVFPKAIIAPHAGYIYSGQIAASAYSILQQQGQYIKRVVLLGPAHKVPLADWTVPSYSHFATPLGNVVLDRIAIDELVQDYGVSVYDDAFAEEHSLEVQLPFLQMLIPDFKLVPILVGACDPVMLSQVIARFWGSKDTLIVVSSDLSHYLSYADAWALDLKTIDAIVSQHPEKITDNQACGRYPLKSLLHFVRALGLNIRAIDVRNSGDTQQTMDRVVGYGAFHVYDADETAGLYTHKQKRLLIEIAKQSIIYGEKNKNPGFPAIERLPFDAKLKRASFVSLHKQGKLRGCIGSLVAHTHVAYDVAQNAFNAAFRDQRFSVVTEAEFKEIQLQISLLTAPTPMNFTSESDLLRQLSPGLDGLIIHDQDKHATYLPSVWSHFPDKKRFLSELKIKAGLDKNHWSPEFKAERFEVDLIE